MKNLINLLFTVTFVSCLFIFSTTITHAQTTTVDIDQNISGNGGAISLLEETGDIHHYLEPDANGTGGFFQVQNGVGSAAFRVDGNATGSNGTISMLGNSASYFYTNLTGNGSVVLPTDAISASETLDEVGVCNATDAGHSFTNVYTNITSQTITAPAAGYILALGSAQLNISHTTGTTLIAEFGVSNVSANLNNVQDLALGFPSGAPSGTYYQAGTAHGIFEATAGVNTIYLVGKENTGDGLSTNDALLTLVYIPSAYGSYTPGFDSDNEDEDKRADLSDNVTESELANINKASIKANQDRMQKEIDDLKALVEKMNANRTDQGNN